MNKPTIGRMVLYNTTKEDREQMNENGNVQPQLPAVIVAVWGDTCINLKVITDGEKDMWITSSLLRVSTDKKDGTWEWPVISPPVEDVNEG